jgi:hypothetical protein
LRRDLDTLEDWIRQIVEFEKIMAESFRQIVEFEKTMNESLDYMGEAEKTMAKIAGAFSDEYTNRDQSAYRASQ